MIRPLWRTVWRVLKKIRYKKYHVGLCVCVYAQSHPTLSDPMGYNPPASSVPAIFQARILEQVAIFCMTQKSYYWAYT